MNSNEKTTNGETQQGEAKSATEAARPVPAWQAGLVAGLFILGAISILFYNALLGLALAGAGIGLTKLLSTNK